jgi:hypothetical protein
MNTTRLDGAVNVNVWLPHHNQYVAPSETVAAVNVSTTAMDAEQGFSREIGDHCGHEIRHERIAW